MLRKYSFGTLISVVWLVSCSKPQAVSSSFYPTAPILSFPNSADRSWTTVLESNPYAQVSGVDGRTIMIGERERALSQDLVAVDIAGNLGIKGALSSASSRRLKKDVERYRGDPLALIRAVDFVRFRYKAEPESSQPHVGFLAEVTPTELSGAQHDSFNINNSLAITMAATKALDREVLELREEVRDLKVGLAKRDRTSAYREASVTRKGRR